MTDDTSTSADTETRLDARSGLSDPAGSVDPSTPVASDGGAPDGLDRFEADADAAEALARMRTLVEEAAGDIERLTDELAERTQKLDDLESVTDAVLGVTETAVVVVGADRRIRAVSRAAVELLDHDGPPIGRPMSAVLPDAVAAAVAARLDEEAETAGPSAGEAATDVDGPAAPSAAEVPAGDLSVSVRDVTAGGFVLVLRRT
jgi:hypothetical protein